MKQHKVIDRFGRVLDDDTKTVPDGATLVVQRLTFMDSNQLSAMEPTMPTLNSRHASLSDAQRNDREAMHAARDKRIQDAWRNPPIGALTQQAHTPAAQAAPPMTDKAAFYAQRDARLSEAWKGAQ